MGRKNKNTIDYFPHYVNHGKTIYILESKFGNDGYATWFKILELLGSSENHFFDCRNTDEWEFLLAKLRVSEDTANEILNILSKLDAIHTELWDNKVIWSYNFMEGIQSVYKRRENSCPQFSDLCKQLSIKCKHKYDSNGVIVSRSTQSIVKKSKEEKSIVELPWSENEFNEVWGFWKKYQGQQFRFTYKTIGEQGALSRLYELSGGELGKAMLIIKQSIQSGWKGLFELKGEFKTQKYDREQIFADLQKG